MKMRDYVLSQIHHEDTPRVPFTFAFEGEVGERIDRHYGNAQWRDRLPRYIVGVGAVDTDMYTSISDTHRRDAYGGVWRVDQRPWHLETPPLAESTLEGYEFPKPQTFYRPEWKEKAFETCRVHADSFLVGSLGWGLFERSWNLRGFENALVDAAAEPDFFIEMVKRIRDLYIDFVKYTVDLPIDAILFGDDWGDQRGVILGPDRWRKLLKPYWAEVYKATHDAGKLVMHHSCGSVAEIIPDLIEIGVNVMESVQPEAQGMNPYELKRRFGKNITFWGCLGSQSTIPHGTPDEIRKEVAHLCAEMPRGGGYILAPAKPLQPETPTENAVAMLESFMLQSPAGK